MGIVSFSWDGRTRSAGCEGARSMKMQILRKCTRKTRKVKRFALACVREYRRAASLPQSPRRGLVRCSPRPRNLLLSDDPLFARADRTRNRGRPGAPITCRYGVPRLPHERPAAPLRLVAARARTRLARLLALLAQCG